MTREQTTRDQCEGPFGPFLSDEERAEWDAFMSRPMTPAEFDAYDAWVSQCEAEWLATRGMLPPF